MARAETDAPPSVRLIRAAVAAMRRHPAVAMLGTGAIGVLVSVATAVYVVGNGETATLRRFGRLIDDAVPPGLGVGIPCGIDQVVTVRTGEVRREEIGSGQGQPMTLVTGDENLIELLVVVQYTVGRLGPFLFGVDDARALLVEAVRGALVETVAAMPVDDVLTGGKARIQQDARRLAQTTLDRADSGITLVGVNLQSVRPPPEAAQAFRAVSDARAHAATAVNDAESARERAINLARGEASAILNEVRAAAAARIQQARGATDRFGALLAQRRAAPAQTDLDLYLASAQRLLPRAQLVVLAPGTPPRIDLNLMPPGPR